MNEDQLYSFFVKNARFRTVDKVCYGQMVFYTIEFNGKTMWDKDTGKLFDKMKKLNIKER